MDTTLILIFCGKFISFCEKYIIYIFYHKMFLIDILQFKTQNPKCDKEIHYIICELPNLQS